MRRLINYESSHHDLNCLDKYSDYKDRLQQSDRSLVAMVTIKLNPDGGFLHLAAAISKLT